MITSDKQILPPSLVRWQKTSHLQFSWWVFFSTLLPLGIHLWKTLQLHNSCLSEYIMFRINEKNEAKFVGKVSRNNLDLNKLGALSRIW